MTSGPTTATATMTYAPPHKLCTCQFRLQREIFFFRGGPGPADLFPSLSQGAGEILGDILDAMSQAGPAVRTRSPLFGKKGCCFSYRVDLTCMRPCRSRARGRAWRTCSGSSRSCSCGRRRRPSARRCAPPSRSLTRHSLPPFPNFRPEPTRPAQCLPSASVSLCFIPRPAHGLSAAPSRARDVTARARPCVGVALQQAADGRPPCRGGGAVALWRANGHLVDRGPRGSASARCCCFAALTSVSSDQGGFYYGRPDEFNPRISYVLAAGRRRREVGGQEEGRAEVGPAVEGPLARD